MPRTLSPGGLSAPASRAFNDDATSYKAFERVAGSNSGYAELLGNEFRRNPS